MSRIVIIGSGVMGSSLAVPAADNGHRVLLVGSPLDGEIIARLRTPGGVHPKLDAPLPENVEPITCDELTEAQLADADLIVCGVSSPGIGWITDMLRARMARPRPVAFVTKGLDRQDGGLSTYAETLPPQIPNMTAFIGIGGPCIARELANRNPTASIYASADPDAARSVADLMRTRYYRLAVTNDVSGVEACAALKNFFAIGVSAMQTRYRDDKRPDGQAKNPCAAAFTQATHEMATLCEEFGGERETAFALAGVGDLHVTVGGGRNSRLGHGLGAGRTVSAMLSGELSGETVEGVDTARLLATSFGDLDTPRRQAFPLAIAIIDAVLGDRPLEFDLAALHTGD